MEEEHKEIVFKQGTVIRVKLSIEELAEMWANQQDLPPLEDCIKEFKKLLIYGKTTINAGPLR